MKEIIKLKDLGNVAYVSPEIQVYELGIENSILALSGGDPPKFGYDEDGWS